MSNTMNNLNEIIPKTKKSPKQLFVYVLLSRRKLVAVVVQSCGRLDRETTAKQNEKK